MKERIKKLLTNRVLIYGVVIVACLANGIAQTAITYDAALGMGDNSTFYAFARNVDNGEIVFKDFIHFRTPGTVLLFASIMKILGQAQSTIEIATRIETLVFYPLLFLIAAMILFRKRSPWYVVLAFLGIALIPGVAQLRAAFGLIAIAVYTLSFSTVGRRRTISLLATGVLASVTFFFGQEIALMVGLCIAAGELLYWKRNEKPWQRLKYLAIGIAVGILPLLIFIGVFSSLSNFLYYTLYYSFVLQPKFMDLPFPGLGYATLLFWLPFFMYWLCFLVLYANKKMNIVDGLVLSFGILRLITAVGRSDMGHFLFSIPEVFLIVPYTVMRARSADLRPQVLRKFLPYGVALAALFLLSTKDGIALAFVPFVILFALSRRSDKLFGKTIEYIRNFSVHLALGSLFVLFVFLLVPTYLAVARTVKGELRANDSAAYRIGGVKTDEITYKEIKAVESAVKPLAPKTIFAFPIQPFYYSMADKHGARFLTFEPQTTIEEQDETITDLRKSKPGVIIFDPLQAQGLSGSLWKISDYVTSNYEVKAVVAMREILWVMVPKTDVGRNDKLVFSLYHDNTSPDIKKVTVPIESPKQNLTNAIGQFTPSLKFETEAPQGASLRVSVRNTTDTDTKTICGVVRVRQAQSTTTRVCSTDGTVTIPIRASKSAATIELQTENGQPLIWNDPSIVD